MKTKVKETETTDPPQNDLLAEENVRIDTIRKLAPETLSSEIIDRCITEGLTVDETRKVFLDEYRKDMKIETGSPRIPSIEVGRDLNQESMPDAMGDAILMRAGVALIDESKPTGEKSAHREPHRRAGQFMQMRLPDMARSVLIASGVEEARSMGDRQAVRTALERAAVTTISLPAILGNATGKSARSGYQEYPVQWPEFCKKATHNDFKQISRIKLSELDNVELVPSSVA